MTNNTKIFALGLFFSIKASLALAEADTSQIDPQLAAWFKEYADVSSPFELKPADFEEYVKTQDSLTAVFLRMRYASTAGKNEKKAMELSREVMSLIKGNKAKEVTEHPLYPYLLEEIIESSRSSRADTALAYTELESHGDRSCPRRDSFLKDLGDNLAKSKDIDALNVQLDQILFFRANGFRKEALAAFLDGLPVDKQPALREKLLPVVREYSKLMEDNSWLLGTEDEATPVVGVKEPVLSLRVISQNAARKKCRTAKLGFDDLLKKYKGDQSNFGPFEQAALKIEECFQRKGHKAREAFWVEVTKPLEAAFGFRGKELARRKFALLKWSRDDFTTARQTFTEILEGARKEKELGIEENALFTLARIEENEGKIESALGYYQKFAEAFPASDRFLDGEMAMVLLNTLKGDVKAALKNTDAIIATQAKLPLDQRNTGALAFALFWSGRLNISIGDKKTAHQMWEQVANEYYSTFYGALGHFMLEKIDGKPFRVKVERAVSFNATEMFAKFDAVDQPTIRRILAMLKIGLREEATCEIAELPVRENENERLLIKSLFQHAAGEWLLSIKNFDALPRSFRNLLPSGFERLLFPRAYDQYVNDYSKRIGMDPDFIFAIIRQESVFNPRANSAAGAQGLMQIMPGTARGEARRLDSSYISKSDRARIARSGDGHNLFDADLNIAIGVHHVSRLLKKYQNPVFVLSSYNANPRATERWIQNLPTEDFLAFIERIPYAETKAYVKLVMRNYFYYKRWYQTTEPKMPHLEDLANNLMAASENLRNETEKKNAVQ